MLCSSRACVHWAFRLVTGSQPHDAVVSHRTSAQAVEVLTKIADLIANLGLSEP